MLSLDNELFIRLSFFISVFAIMGMWELAMPRRTLRTSKATRWLANLSVTVVNSLLVRLVLPILAIEMAFISAARGWGIFHIFRIPDLLAGILSIILLDLMIYLQHVVFHRFLPLWKLHMMHHTDIDLDVTTGARFHPFEILLSMGIKIGAVAALGAPVWSVLVFEILLNATSMFNHSNVFIPVGTDNVLRLFVVTPDMHRVHHSVMIKETNSNYGFNFPWWDRLFKTYRAQPIRGHTTMNIGLANFRDPKSLTLGWLLAIPFLGKER
jgi:sterol desaturase/sphingolipid hydroxylase (fatty acid hydroxylase superfamily)